MKDNSQTSFARMLTKEKTNKNSCQSNPKKN